MLFLFKPNDMYNIKILCFIVQEIEKGGMYSDFSENCWYLLTMMIMRIIIKKCTNLVAPRNIGLEGNS